MSRVAFAVALALSASLAAATSRADQAVNHVPDGVYPSPTVSEMVTHPSPECPDKAVFRRDSTDYTEWANNVPVSKWTNTSESFLRCVDAQGETPE